MARAVTPHRWQEAQSTSCSADSDTWKLFLSKNATRGAGSREKAVGSARDCRHEETERRTHHQRLLSLRPHRKPRLVHGPSKISCRGSRGRLWGNRGIPYGDRNVHRASPVESSEGTNFGGFALLAAAPTVAVFVVVQVARRVSNFTMARPAREVLFTSISRDDRYKAKNLIDTVVYRSGDQVGSWAYVGLIALGLNLTGVAIVAAPLSLAWLALGFWLGGRQPGATKTSLLRDFPKSSTVLLTHTRNRTDRCWINRRRLPSRASRRSVAAIAKPFTD